MSTDSDNAPERAARVLVSRPANQLLASLPAEDLRRLHPALKTVPLRSKEVLQKQHEPLRYVHFLNGGVASVTTLFSNGKMVEVALVGSEGMLGIEALFADRPVAAGERTIQVVDANSDAERLPVEDFRRELARRGALYDLVGLYAQAKLSEIFQTAGCNALHSVRERCARWLLMTDDRMHRHEFALSHDLLASLLGVSRPTVSTVAGALQRAGFIHYSHGHLAVLDRKGLEHATCECYGVMRTAFERMSRACRSVG